MPWRLNINKGFQPQNKPPVSHGWFSYNYNIFCKLVVKNLFYMSLLSTGEKRRTSNLKGCVVLLKVTLLTKNKIDEMYDYLVNDSRYLMLKEEIEKSKDLSEHFNIYGYEFKNDNDISIKETIFVEFENDVIFELSKGTTESSGVYAYFHIDDKIKKLTVKNKEITKRSEDLDYSPEFFNFIKINTQESEVTTQNWWEGCLVFGDPATGYHYYRHCGAKCGDQPGSTGGGTPINYLDKCCRSHDTCWETYGKDYCMCDRNLAFCAELSIDPGWYMVGTWAATKSCRS